MLKFVTMFHPVTGDTLEMCKVKVEVTWSKVNVTA